jgi:hypothetical protein
MSATALFTGISGQIATALFTGISGQIETALFTGISGQILLAGQSISKRVTALSIFLIKQNLRNRNKGIFSVTCRRVRNIAKSHC